MPKRPPRKDYVIIPIPLRVHASPDYAGKGVTIAFIDSGFYPHPALTKPRDRIRALVDVTSEKLTAGDFETIYASSWHGTMVACTACGNGYFSKGYYHGIAHEAQVVLVKAFDGKKIGSSNLLRALQWIEKNAAALNVRIVNISVGGGGTGSASKKICSLVKLLTKRGIVIVVASGNTPGRTPVAPASCDGAITVGGIDDNNSTDSRQIREYATSHGVMRNGLSKPDLVAPSNLLPAPMLPANAIVRESEVLHQLYKVPLKRLGREIKKAAGAIHLPADILKKTPKEMRQAIHDRMTAEKFFAPYYQHVDGTSFAAPIVTSIVAQMLEANPNLTPEVIHYILRKTARHLPDIAPVKQGAGLITASECVRWALLERELGDSYAPTVSDTRIVFRLQRPRAKRVELVGDFTAWQRDVMPMSYLGNGLWRVDIPRLTPGRYAYKFLIDGENWINDPHNPLTEPDRIAGVNNIVVVSTPSH